MKIKSKDVLKPWRYLAVAIGWRASQVGDFAICRHLVEKRGVSALRDLNSSTPNCPSQLASYLSYAVDLLLVRLGDVEDAAVGQGDGGGAL